MASGLRLWTALIILIALAGCNFPGLAPPTPTEFPPPTVTTPETPAGTSTSETVATAETNLALNAPVTATSFIPGFEPDKAVDGIGTLDLDNWWSAGAGPPQNIEIDLGGPSDISRIRLVVSQSPSGETLHLVLGRRPGDSQNVTLGQLSGETADGDELVLEPGNAGLGIRFVIVQTVVSPSWVAWREIEIFGVPGEAACPEPCEGSPDEPTGTVPPTEPAAVADLILTNADVLTMDANLPEAEAIAIHGDRILAVGTDEEMQAYQGANTQVIDLAGRTVTPGFIDSHTHRIGDRWLYGNVSAEQVIQEAIEGGWTSLSELFVSQDRLNELTMLAGADLLRVRVSMYLTMNFHYERSDWWTAYEPLHEYDPYLRIGGLKITLDQEWGETVFFDQAQLTEMVTFAADRGWQIATHAFTPATDMMILNAYEAAIQAHPDEDLRYRLEHIGVITDEGIQKMAGLGVIGSVQFIAASRYVLDDSFIQYIPQELWPLVARWRDLIDAGVLLVGNVDAPWCCTPWRDPNAPVTTGTVMTAIYEAATRRTYDGREPEPWQLSQVVTVAEALEMLTIRGAYAGYQEAVLGSLTPGKYADLVVLSANPLEVAVEEIPGIEVMLTMIGGVVEHCPPGQGEICP